MRLGRLALFLLMLLAPGVGWAADGAQGPLYQALGAPDGWTINGSFRTRLEGIDGQFRPGLPYNDGFVSLRTTLFAQYDAGPVRFGGELIDARGYFERTRSSVGTTEIDAVELSQGYIAFDLGGPLGKGTATSITVGRFTQDIGSRRLVARNVFRNTINSFTGVKLDWNDAAHDKAILFWSMPQTRLPDTSAAIQSNDVELDRESPDLQFYGGSFTKAGVFGGTLEGYVYRLYEADSPALQTANRRLVTPGIRLARAPKTGMFDYDFEGVYQFGKRRLTTLPTDLVDRDVKAYFIHAEIGRTFTGAWSPRVALQYDRASGNGRNANDYNRFDTLFGARRGEYGPTSLDGAVQRANLSSPAVRVEVTPDNRWDAFVAYRPLWLDSPTDSFAATGVRDAKGNSGDFAGHQIEARARYWLIPRIARLDGGFAYLAKGRFLTTAPNAPRDDDTRYGYLDVTFGF